MAIQSNTVTVYTTSDGSQFESLTEAELYEVRIEKAAEINRKVEQFLNFKGLTGRARSMKESAVREFIEFDLVWDGETEYPEPEAPVQVVKEEKADVVNIKGEADVEKVEEEVEAEVEEKPVAGQPVQKAQSIELDDVADVDPDEDLFL